MNDVVSFFLIAFIMGILVGVGFTLAIVYAYEVLCDK
ncbi:hypothetical protein [Sulfolobus spindle-shaped virus]|nr:hypothetical protein [Sulfolobus spindle-shaped virus]